jgi:hypothetical protein
MRIPDSRVPDNRVFTVIERDLLKKALITGLFSFAIFETFCFSLVLVVASTFHSSYRSLMCHQNH